MPAALSLRGLAAGIEGVGDDLGRLAAGHIGVGPEVGAVGGWDTRLVRPAATVAADNLPMRREALDEQPEGLAVGHILKRLLGRRNEVGILGSVAVNLGGLAAGDDGVGAEVGPVAGRH